MRRERWTRLDEQEKVMRSERSRYSLERDTERQRGLILKLTVQLDELQLKYEPGQGRFPLLFCFGCARVVSRGVLMTSCVVIVS